MNILQELRALLRELRELLHSLRRRHKLAVAVIIQQECVLSNPASLVTGKPAQATAVAVDSSGNPVATTFAWSTDNAAAATIDPSTGAITLTLTGNPGDSAQVNIIATDPGGDTGTCACTVTVAGPGVLKITVDVTQ